MFEVIDEMEVKEISTILGLIYGEPDTGKTSLTVNMAEKALLIDTNKGHHRALRASKTIMLKDWQQMEDAMKKPQGGGLSYLEGFIQENGITLIVIDTIEDFLVNYLQEWLKQKDQRLSQPKFKFQLFGALKDKFQSTLNYFSGLGCDVFFIAHQREEKRKDESDLATWKPLITGGSYNIVMSLFDLVAYMYVGTESSRVIAFEKSDLYKTKNAGNLRNVALPNYMKDGEVDPKAMEAFRKYTLSIIPRVKERLNSRSEQQVEFQKKLEALEALKETTLEQWIHNLNQIKKEGAPAFASNLNSIVAQVAKVSKQEGTIEGTEFRFSEIYTDDLKALVWHNVKQYAEGVQGIVQKKGKFSYDATLAQLEEGTQA